MRPTGTGFFFCRPRLLIGNRSSRALWFKSVAILFAVDRLLGPQDCGLLCASRWPFGAGLGRVRPGGTVYARLMNPPFARFTAAVCVMLCASAALGAPRRILYVTAT